MPNIISVAPPRRRRRGPLLLHFGSAAVVALHLPDDEADDEDAEEGGDDDDDDEEALARRRQAVQRLLRLQITDLVNCICARWPCFHMLACASASCKLQLPVTLLTKGQDHNFVCAAGREGHLVSYLERVVYAFLFNFGRSEQRLKIGWAPNPKFFKSDRTKPNRSYRTIAIATSFSLLGKSEDVGVAEIMAGRRTHRFVERHVEEDAVDEIVLGDVGHAGGGEHRVHEVGVDHRLRHRAGLACLRRPRQRPPRCI